MVAEARDEPGALPLVENALHWLWEQRTDGRLSGRLLNDHGGLAGILSQSADDLLAASAQQRDRALELLFRLVKVDPEGRRHTRQRMPLADAVAVAGGGAARSGAGRSPRRHARPGRPEGSGPAAADHGHRGRRRPDDGPARQGLGQPDPRDADPQQGLGRQGRTAALLADALALHRAAPGPGARGASACSYWRGSGRTARDSHGFSGSPAGRSCSAFAGSPRPAASSSAICAGAHGRACVQAGILVAIVGVVGKSLHWKTVNELPLEAVWTRWAYKLGNGAAVPEAHPDPGMARS